MLLQFSGLQRFVVGRLFWTAMSAVLGFNYSVYREGDIVGRTNL